MTKLREMAEKAAWNKLKRGVAIEPTTGCWLWTGRASKNGYVSIRVNGKAMTMHRFAWEHHHNTKMSKGLLACHTCDVRHCVNPLHVFPGTHKANMMDAAEKRRVGSAAKKISNDDVADIRRRLLAGERTKEIAAEFGVCHSTISQIGSGRRRTRDNGETRRKTNVGAQNGQSKLTESVVREMRAKYAAGASVADLVREYQVSVGTVSPMLHRKTWKHVDAITAAERGE